MKPKDSSKSPPEPPTPVEHRRISRLLPVALTDTDRLRFCQEMADAKDQKDRLEAQAKEVSQDFKAKIAAQDTLMGSRASSIRAGYQYMDTPCEVRLATPTPNQKTIVRLDTMAVVETLEMTDEDRQALLPFPALKSV